MCVCVCARAYVHIFSHVWLFATMDCSLPDSSVHGIFQARILKWVAIPFSRGSSWPRHRIRFSHIAGRLFTVWVGMSHEKYPGSYANGIDTVDMDFHWAWLPCPLIHILSPCTWAAVWLAVEGLQKMMVAVQLASCDSCCITLYMPKSRCGS